MKRVLLLSAFFAVIFSSNSFASASDYVIDDIAVEQTLNNAIEIAVNNLDVSPEVLTNVLSENATLEGKVPVIAFVLATIGITNFFAIHRLYLGGTPILILAYPFFTFLTLGILNIGDWIVLLIDVFRNDLGKHEGSDALFMW